MEKELKKLNKYLFHSKLAVFAIVGFLIIITYLLIIVSKQVSDSEISFNYTPAAKTADVIEQPDDIILPPGEYPSPGTPLTCYDYQSVISRMHLELEKLQRQCPRCRRQPTGIIQPGFSQDGEIGAEPDVIVPTDSCSRYLYLHTYLNGLKEMIAGLCARCPAPTKGLPPITPGITWIQITGGIQR